MSKIHEANRRHWNNQATTWEERLNRDGRWRRCHREPELAFEGETLTIIREMVGNLRDKQVCIIGSGDNMAAYALSGLGAAATSTDVTLDSSPFKFPFLKCCHKSGMGMYICVGAFINKANKVTH